MENDTMSPETTDSPTTAATKSFLGSFAWNMALFSAVGLAFDRVFRGTPFRQETWARLKDDALINGILASGFGLWEAHKTYKNTQAAYDFSKKSEKPVVSVIPSSPERALITTSDASLQTELAHTQQALSNVSHELEVVTNHAANLKAPTESHVEQAVIDKASAERATATIH